MSIFTYCVLLNPCSTLILFKDLTIFSFVEKNLEVTKQNVFPILSVALLGFQYVFSMHCLMLTIEAMLICIKPTIAFYAVCPSIGSVAQKSLHPPKKYISFLLQWVVWLYCDFLRKCCMFLTYFHEV